MSRKPRSDSEWEKLSVIEKDSCIAWLFDENLSFPDCAKRFHEFYERPIGLSALKRGYQSVSQQRFLAEVALSRDKSRSVMDAVRKNPGEMFGATMAAVENIALRIAMDNKGQIDVASLYSLVKLMLDAKAKEQKDRELGQTDRRIALLEKREEQAKGVIQNPVLTDAEKQERMKELFGLT